MRGSRASGGVDQGPFHPNSLGYVPRDGYCVGSGDQGVDTWIIHVLRSISGILITRPEVSRVYSERSHEIIVAGTFRSRWVNV
jgi:hypothetical protein